MTKIQYTGDRASESGKHLTLSAQEFAEKRRAALAYIAELERQASTPTGRACVIVARRLMEILDEGER